MIRSSVVGVCEPLVFTWNGNNFFSTFLLEIVWNAWAEINLFGKKKLYLSERDAETLTSPSQKIYCDFIPTIVGIKLFSFKNGYKYSRWKFDGLPRYVLGIQTAQNLSIGHTQGRHWGGGCPPLPPRNILLLTSR